MNTRKSLLLSIRPNWVKLILNKKKIYEIRKQFPKEYIGWVYIYCTLDTKNGYLQKREIPDYFPKNQQEEKYRCVSVESLDKSAPILNGKVVARFFCNKVLELRPFSYGGHTWWIEKTTTNYRQFLQILQRSLLTEKQIKDYAKRKNELFSVVIDKLEIFDTPKELGEFYKVGVHKDLRDYFTDEKRINGKWCIPLKKPPQNFMFIEIN